MDEIPGITAERREMIPRNARSRRNAAAENRVLWIANDGLGQRRESVAKDGERLPFAGPVGAKAGHVIE